MIWRLCCSRARVCLFVRPSARPARNRHFLAAETASVPAGIGAMFAAPARPPPEDYPLDTVAERVGAPPQIEKAPGPITHESIFSVVLYFAHPATLCAYRLSTIRWWWGGGASATQRAQRGRILRKQPADAEFLCGRDAAEQRESGRPQFRTALTASKMHRWMPTAQGLRVGAE